MSPPAAKPRSGSSGGRISAEAPSQTERMIRALHKILDAYGIAMSSSKVSRLIRQFQSRRGRSFLSFLADRAQLSATQYRRMLADPDMARLLAYLGPTGEAAVNNVLCQAARR